MNFDDLKKEFPKDADLKDAENKQRLNLSEQAYSVLLRDMDQFLAESSHQAGLGSTIINQVFRRYREDAEASVVLACRRKQASLEQILSSMESAARKTAVELLLEEYRQQLKAQIHPLLKEKGRPIYVRVSMDNMIFLKNTDPELWAFYRKKPGLYMKALLEEYARKSTVERERIFFQEIIRQLREGMEIDVILMLHRRNGSSTYIRPYKLLEDIDHQHLYLAGYISDKETGPWYPGSTRISTVTDCQILPRRNLLSGEQVSKLETAIAKYGVQFLSDDSEKTETIQVRFTPSGEKMFRRVLHLRPNLESYDPQTRTGTFLCTFSQAEFYFMRFADKAKILSPEKLAKHMHKAYAAAAEQYK